MFLNGIRIHLLRIEKKRKCVLRKFSSSKVRKSICTYEVKRNEPPCGVFDSCHVGEIGNQPKIVIVGAGVAGLSAAQRLLQCGLTDITIVDGLSRPGGRIHTDNLGGCYIDLGAQWIYGSTIGNPIFNIAAQEGLIKQPVKPREPNRGFFYTSDGKAIDSFVYEKAKRIFDNISQKAFLYSSKQIEYINITFWDFFKKAIMDQMKKLTRYEQNYSQRVILGLTNDLKSKFAADLSDITLGSLNHIHQIVGGDVCVKSGFSGILKPLMANIPKEALKLGKPVKKVRWYTGTDPRAQVILTDGTVVSGDYIILTVSLGVLKENHSQLLIPPIPKKKSQAIEAIGYGHANKVFLQYEQPFWVEGEGIIRPAWSPEEMKDRTQWIHSLGMIEEAPCPGNTLMLEIGGTEATYLESASDQEVTEQLTCLMRNITGNVSIPAPKAVVKSAWSYNPLFMGAKSYMTKDTFPKHFKDLSTPLPEIGTNAAPTLFFAGEATVYGNHGTVHGARLSGIREADTIVTLTKRFCGRPPITLSSKTCGHCML
ncbi:peroxisomal N(1)-acetyl-spermine/spermidine oxidase-like [Cimex lectularius]|uniref:Amine oxidase domain-containing protein n=1 Tax=Cimex lectularius TaxID=79782 RepID=A0A8I6S0G1_CIMLE|nr:peroxisomal N(1)-acetyl-spermine/spermidine oxidase-like [Cimex lectularius]